MRASFHGRAVGCGLLIAVAAMTVSLAARQNAAAPVTIQAALAADVGTIAGKFEGLARVMAGKYDWRPGQGVRSVGEVLNLIVAENRLLAGLLTGAPGPGRGGAQPPPITDATAMQEALRVSYATLRQAVAGVGDADLNTDVSLFGQNTTKRGAVLMVLFDQHEHLGQSIAYARSTGVVPPWSK